MCPAEWGREGKLGASSGRGDSKYIMFYIGIIVIDEVGSSHLSCT
jgi:hypothetical protein